MCTHLKIHTHILGWHKVLVVLITKQDMSKHMTSFTEGSGKKKGIKLGFEATNTCHWGGTFKATSLFLVKDHCCKFEGTSTPFVE